MFVVPLLWKLREMVKSSDVKALCLAMQSEKYCCTGEYANPKACKPTSLFKAICPKAYSYAFDDSSSLNKCRASCYVITFCPPK
uniref:Thaumatin-like protein n=1 Tax=Noccaea caerulescens TaxID=107243 RepID=A0A1J3CGH3_NOCCA